MAVNVLRIQFLHKLTHKMQVGIPVVFDSCNPSILSLDTLGWLPLSLSRLQVACSTDGSDKLSPLVIGIYKILHCFKNVKPARC